MIQTISLDSYLVPPDTPGAAVGTATAHGATGAVTYALTADASGLFQLDGSTLRLKPGVPMTPGSRFWADVELTATAGADSHAQVLRVVRDDFADNAVVAHRGAFQHGRGGRNSMTAFRDAIAHGFGAFECDVLWSSDHQVVVAHGPSSASEGGTPGYDIVTTPWALLSQVYLGNGDYISSLSDVLDEVTRQNRTRIVIEIKDPKNGTVTALAAAVAGIVTARRAQAWVSYISFADAALDEILTLDPSSRCAPLGNSPALPAVYVAKGMWGVDFQHDAYSPPGTGDGRTIADFKAAGLDVNMYTVNDSAALSGYLAQGADRITTDEPERLLSIADAEVPGVYHVSYKSASGTLAINRFHPDGRRSVEVGRVSDPAVVPPGFTIVEPFAHGGDSYALCYRGGSSPLTRIFEISRDGRGVSPVWTSSWTDGWTLLQFFTHGGARYHLTYKQAVGTVAINRVDNPSAGTVEVWRGDWGAGWTCARAFALNGEVYLLRNNHVTGAVGILRVDDPESGALSPRWSATWSTGWTHLRVFAFEGRLYHLSYKQSAGTVAVNEIQPGASGTTEVWRNTWTSGWTDFEFFTAGSRVGHLSVRAGDGDAAVNHVNPDARGTTEVERSSWTSGWTAVRAFTID